MSWLEGNITESSKAKRDWIPWVSLSFRFHVLFGCHKPIFLLQAWSLAFTVSMNFNFFFPPCSLPLIKSKKMPFWLTFFFFFTIFYLDFIYTVFIPNYLLLMQHTSISPDRKLMTVVGDHLDGLLVDPQNGKVHTWFLKIVVNYSDQIEIYFIIYLCTCCWSVSVCLSLV